MIKWIVAAAIDTYEAIFERRGASYDEAMTTAPHARAEEFRRVVAWMDPQPGHVVCDVPSGPGDLRRYVDRSVTLVHVEPSMAFARRCRARATVSIAVGTLETLPLRARSVDRVVSLAALHHVADKRAFVMEAARILKPTGMLCVADVCSGSPVAAFLNDFVDAHNSMGHRGAFIDEALDREIADTGCTVDRAARETFPWRFASRAAMATFAQRLFGLDRATPAETLAGIDRHLGTYTEAGAHCLNWELRFVRAVKR